jgi:hypothetical protein
MAAKVMLELSPLAAPTRPNEGAVECFNLVNPKSCQWGALAAVVQRYYAERGTQLVGVGLDEWLDELRAVDARKEAEKAQDYPALKLLEFFEGMSADSGQGGWGFATERGVERSMAMAGLGPVDEAMMRKWLSEWAF